MKFEVRTKVDQPLKKVKEGFDESLFRELSPPFPTVKVLKFDGSKPGDLVEIELNFLVTKQRWVSQITDEHNTESHYYFKDEGLELPFMLKSWQHTHHIISREEGSEIVDEVVFSSGNRFMDILIYPALLLQFLYRKPIYRRIFG